MVGDFLPLRRWFQCMRWGIDVVMIETAWSLYLHWLKIGMRQNELALITKTPQMAHMKLSRGTYEVPELFWLPNVLVLDRLAQKDEDSPVECQICDWNSLSWA